MIEVLTPRWVWAAGLVLAAACRPAAAQVTTTAPLGPPGHAAPTAAAPSAAALPPGLVPPDCPPGPGPCGRCGHTQARPGCKRCLQQSFIGFPEEFCEWPLGWSLYTHGRTMVSNGDSARMVFYHYDFVDGTSRLNLRGLDKLPAVLSRLPATFDPVIVERTPHAPGLDGARRRAVLAGLSGGAFPVPPERVIVATPVANGLPGLDAALININRLGAVANGGAIAPASTGSSFTGVGVIGGAGTGAGAPVLPR